MKIGLSYDLKENVHTAADCPDDALEEYDSRETVQAIAGALESIGHSVVNLGGGREFLSNITCERIDMVFNIAEGLGNLRSREAQVPSVLEMLGIPYSGSDPQCLAICLDKPLAKKLVATAGVATPRWRVINDISQFTKAAWNGFPFPAIMKPSHEGSSKGIRHCCVAENARQATDLAEELLSHYHQPVMIEEFINGDEVTVGVIGNSPPTIIGAMRILPRKQEPYFIYSIEVKRDWENLVEYECPAGLEPATLEMITQYSLSIFDVLGCRDFARVDFRIASDGMPYFLEINPLPGLNPYSGDLPIMAGRSGWTYPALISAILTAATQRYTRC